MSVIAFFLSAIVTVIPTVTLGYANGVTVLGAAGMCLSALAIMARSERGR